MAGFTTYSELRQDILDRAGEPTDGSSDYHAAAGRQLVRAAYEIYNAHPFLFLRKYPPGVLRTVAPITAGTVRVTLDDISITFSNAPVASVANRKLVVSGWPEVYRISSHFGGAAAAILDSHFNGPSNAAAAYTVFQDEYDLASDVRHLVAMTAAELANPIPQRSEEYLHEQYPDPPVASWPPLFFARIGETKIRFAGYPNRARRLEYSYTILGDDIDTGTIYVPANWRYVLADAGLFWLEETMEDSRSKAAAVLFAGGLEKMIEDDARKRVALHGGTPAAGPYR